MPDVGNDNTRGDDGASLSFVFNFDCRHPLSSGTPPAPSTSLHSVARCCHADTCSLSATSHISKFQHHKALLDQMAVTTASAAIHGMHLVVTPLQLLSECAVKYTFDQLPLKAELSATTVHAQTFWEFRERIDQTSLADVLRSMEDDTVLPVPFGSNGVLPPNELQMCVFPSGDGHFNLIKCIRFKTRALISKITAQLTGKVLYVDQSKMKAPRFPQLIMQHMLINLGGECIVNRDLAVSEPSTKKTRTDLQIDAGYDFINCMGP
eukprot:4734095-Amphidinium_carterae.1